MYTIREIKTHFHEEEYIDYIKEELDYVDVHSLNRELFQTILRKRYGESKLDEVLRVKEHMCASNRYDLRTLCELLYIIDESEFDPVKLPFLLYCDKQSYSLAPEQLRSALQYCGITLSSSDVRALVDDLCNGQEKETNFNLFQALLLELKTT